MKLPFSDRRLRALAGRYGTPFFAYDFEALERQARSLSAALFPRFEIFYAVKANPSLAVLKTFARLGLGADVASRGEIAAALAAGFPPERLVMAGPGKTERDLDAAARARLLGINVEGPAELDRLERIARRLRRRIPVQLRLNPPGGRRERVLIIGGEGAGKFGMSPALARETLAARPRWPHLDISGFHVFQASNELDADAFVGNVRRILDLALDFARRYEVPMRIVDFGGGFGIPYEPDEEPLDLARLKRGLRKVAEEADAEPLLAGTRLLFEPGRFLSGPAGVYVGRVLEVKESAAGPTPVYAVVDGGIHHMLRPALFGPHPVRLIAARRRSGRRKPVTVGGPLCTSQDVLASSILLPVPAPGDLVALANAGAYGYTESMPLFLSHEWPAEIGVRGRYDARLRRPPTAAELLAAQKLPRGLLPG